jgi:hypothetical protein
MTIDDLHLPFSCPGLALILTLEADDRNLHVLNWLRQHFVTDSFEKFELEEFIGRAIIRAHEIERAAPSTATATRH